MFVNINDIKIKDGRREAAPKNVQKLAESIREVGMIHPITIGRDNTLIAGLHRLSAAKSLGWTQVDCTVTDLEGLQAEMAEIDENLIRTPLSVIETDNLLYRRKQIYEELHPETKHGGVRQTGGGKLPNCPDAPVKSFAEDTAEKLGVSPRTVSRSVQRARDMTQDAKDIIQNSGQKVTRQNLDKLSHLEPEQQKEAAEQLSAGTIQSVDEYQELHKEKAAARSAAEYRDKILRYYGGVMAEVVNLVNYLDEELAAVMLLTLSTDDMAALLKCADEAKTALDIFSDLANCLKERKTTIEKEKENQNGSE